MHRNQKGFGVVEIIIFIVLIGLIGAVIYLFVQNRDLKQEDQTATQQETAKKPQANEAAPAELTAGDFGEKGDYGTFQAEGYAKVLRVLDDSSGDCGMNNPGVECTKIDGVFFIITKTPNAEALTYVKNNNNPEYPADSFVMGCPANGVINYSNSSDAVSKSYTISKEDTTKLLASTAEKPIQLEITKGQLTYGKDAPVCYSGFTTYKILAN